MTKQFIAYTRVSTSKQGTQGVSLSEQRRAIEQYAQKQQLSISAWHEETITAAKRGRPIFRKVMNSLHRNGGKVGLIMHKVDRGARNLWDWAYIGDALDRGIVVRFVHDDVDLQTRGGRLSADIQAVIAADYIRNLRDEVRKGINGPLEQGLYPFKAPRGYLDRGSGKAKVPDPLLAPLIVSAFRKYASRAFSLSELAAELEIQGLTTRSEKALRPGSLAKLLRNPFYKGTVTVCGTSYTGIHQPLVSESLFNRVASPRSRYRSLIADRNTTANKHDVAIGVAIRKRKLCPHKPLPLLQSCDLSAVYEIILPKCEIILRRSVNIFPVLTFTCI